jgi:hypothetical protein
MAARSDSTEESDLAATDPHIFIPERGQSPYVHMAIAIWRTDIVLHAVCPACRVVRCLFFNNFALAEQWQNSEWLNFIIFRGEREFSTKKYYAFLVFFSLLIRHYKSSTSHTQKSLFRISLFLGVSCGSRQRQIGGRSAAHGGWSGNPSLLAQRAHSSGADEATQRQQRSGSDPVAVAARQWHWQ